jgi:hypothetical protein
MGYKCAQQTYWTTYKYLKCIKPLIVAQLERRAEGWSPRVDQDPVESTQQVRGGFGDLVDVRWLREVRRARRSLLSKLPCYLLYGVGVAGYKEYTGPFGDQLLRDGSSQPAAHVSDLAIDVSFSAT